MIKPLLFYFPSEEKLAKSLSHQGSFELGHFTHRYFPDGESYLQIHTPVQGREVFMLCSLNQADAKLLPLIFFADTARELGALSIKLMAPYLGYMRQDKRFHDGEAITSHSFAQIVSQHFDALCTVDPHLHRRKSLSEIYSIPTQVLHVAPLLAQWIQQNVSNPLLIGPDQESEQWVSEVAAKANAPYVVLEKTRLGDREVQISIPQIEKWENAVPVLVDDIISTGKTMFQTLKHLQDLRMPKGICLGVHGIFSGNAYKELLQGGAAQVVTCNTVFHVSNQIEIVDLLEEMLRDKDKI